METHYEFWRNDTIKRFTTDLRQYRTLILSNGISVLLISDPNSTQSALSLSISVGSFCDPEKLPGLANLCMRMLPLGTNVYQEDFIDFIKKYNGQYSSYTETDHTNFYAAIEPGLFHPVMERFARFFIEPIFPRCRIESEINVIDTQHRNKISENIRNLSQLKRIVYNNYWPLNHFRKGSKESLLGNSTSMGINIYNYLIEFYCKWYSAHLMQLAVYSTEDIPTLEKLVVCTFSNILQKCIYQPMWSSVIYRDTQFTTKTIVYSKTNSLNLSFLIPDQRENFMFMPALYLKLIFEHQGATGLIAKLRNNGWAEKLSANSKCEARNIFFFEIDLLLTNSGVDNVENIITFVFQYIKMVKNEGIQKWFLEENLYTNRINLVYEKKTPLKYVCSLTPKMINFELHDILIAENRIELWRPELIHELLLFLTPRDIRVIVASNKFKYHTMNIEKYYGTKYTTTTISMTDILKWENYCDICNDFKMPPVNEFLFNDFTILPYNSNEPIYPEMIYESFFLKCWFKRDLVFNVPKIFMSIEMLSSVVTFNYLFLKTLNLFGSLFNDYINAKYKNAFSIAGYELSILPWNNGLKIQLNGFNNRLPHLLEIIISELFSFNADPLSFDKIKKEAIRKIKKKILPYKLAIKYSYILLSENDWATNDIDVINDISIEDIKTVTENFFSQLHVETLVYGNIQKDKAIELNKIIEDALFEYAKSHIVISGKLNKPREIRLNDGEKILFQIVNFYNFKSSGIFINLQCGPQNINNIVLINLFSELIKNPCNTILKKMENIGSVVETVMKINNGILYWGIVVQSTLNPEYVHMRIENFINRIEEILEDTPQSTFDVFKKYLASEFFKEPNSFDEQALMYESEISSREYYFERSSSGLYMLNAITKNDIIRFYHKYIHTSGPNRSMLAVYVISKSNRTQPNNMGNVINHNCTILSDLDEFKDDHALYPVSNLTSLSFMIDHQQQ